jgi:CpXC motif protein
MAKPTRMTIQCPRCGQPVNAMVERIVDPGQDPQAKARLLSGQLNGFQCPNCGMVSNVAAPLVYHDADKELLITYVPMELALPKDKQEKMIGDLLREVMSTIPQEKMKGYVFKPREAFTMQGLVDQILQADGVTPEMMEEQRARVQLVEQLVQTPADQLDAFVQEHDADIDPQFFQIFTLMTQRIAAEGREEIVEQLMAVQRAILENSTLGQQLVAQSQAQEQVVAEVADAVRALGAKAQRQDFLNLAIELFSQEDGDERLQALVGLVRPAFDQVFFQELTGQIGQAPADQRDQLQALRDRLTELVSAVDQQTQAALQDAVEMLQAIVTSPNPDAVIQENAPFLDETFLAVLTANLQEAERQGNIQASSKFRDVYNRVMGILRENMQPELRFINDLLGVSTDAEAQAMLADQAGNFGPPLLDMMDAVREALTARGETAALDRLATLREWAEKVLG